MKLKEDISSLNFPSTPDAPGGSTALGNDVIKMGIRYDLNSGQQQKDSNNGFGEIKIKIGNIVKGKNKEGKKVRGKVIRTDKRNNILIIQKANGNEEILDFSTCIILQESLFDGKDLFLEFF